VEAEKQEDAGDEADRFRDMPNGDFLFSTFFLRRFLGFFWSFRRKSKGKL
jgi:hypothetical protein